jgi:hypothetical protein
VEGTIMPSVDQLVRRLSDEITAARERVYHFYTKESLQEFDKAPFESIATEQGKRATLPSR